MATVEPKLTIGIPVYNGATYLRAALDSILKQDFINFKVIISDNASTDETGIISKEFENSDPRISYIKQSKNIGQFENFLFLSQDISTPYFMWFSCDDIMEQGFLSHCVGSLEKKSQYGMAFTGIANIDSIGRIIREYPNIPLLSGCANLKTIKNFVTQPEIFGKANLFYSVYRTSIVKRALARFGFPRVWGTDMCFVMAALVQGGVLISPNVMFKKRLVREGDDGPNILSVEISDNLLDQGCPLSSFKEYRAAMVRAASGSRMAIYVMLLMWQRHLKLKKLSA